MKKILYLMLLKFLLCIPQTTIASDTIDSTLIPISETDFEEYSRIYEEEYHLSKYDSLIKNPGQLEALKLLPTRYIFQSSLKNKNDQPYNSMKNRFTFINQDWELFFLTHNDAAESDIADLYRISLKAQSQNVKFIVGDFAAKFSSSLALSSKPTFQNFSGNTSNRTFYPITVINRSVEEGRGWRGITFNFTSKHYSAELWSGFASYDAYISNNILYFYSEQGNHIPSRKNNPVIEENMTGFCLRTGIKKINISVLQFWSVFNEKFDTENQSSRFQNLKQEIHSTAISVNYKNTKYSFNLEGKLDSNTEKAAILSASQNTQLARNSITAYWIDSDIIQIHSRPSVPFTSNIAGKRGISFSSIIPVRKFRFGGWFGVQRDRYAGHKKSLFGGNIFSTFKNKNLNITTLAFFRNDYEENGNYEEAETVGIRLKFSFDRNYRSVGLRSELSERDKKEASVITIFYQEQINRFFKYDTSISYINPLNGKGVVSVYQNTSYGEFPLALYGGRGLSYSIKASYRLWKGWDFWGSLAFYENKLDNDINISDNNKYGKLTWRVGFLIIVGKENGR